jgi:hypothetical protein
VLEASRIPGNAASGDAMSDLSLVPILILLLAVFVVFAGRRSSVLETLREQMEQASRGASRSLARLLASGARERSRLLSVERELAQLLDELKRHMPVYSAETVHGREAEFIRDRLPKKFSLVLFVLALALFSAAAWWFGR